MNTGEVQVWEVETGEEVFNLNVPDNAFSVAFSADGKRLIAASGRQSRNKSPVEVKMWEMETGVVAFTLRGFDRPVHGVAFSPDGKRIATVGGGTLKVFNGEKTEFDALPGLNSAYELYSEMIADTKTPPEARTNALLNRWQVLRHLNRPAEALADYLLAKNIPVRDPQTRPNLIDLSAHYNAALDEPWYLEGSALSSLPTGVQRLAGVEFDVRGLIQVGARSFAGNAYPERISGMIVGRECERLHFLHAAINAASTKHGTQLGTYVVHYANGQQQEIPILAGIDVADWSSQANETDTQFTVAWTGTNEQSAKRGRSIRLFKTTWQNPHADVQIAAIDFVFAENAPAGKNAAAPFLVAITAEP